MTGLRRALAALALIVVPLGASADAADASADGSLLEQAPVVFTDEQLAELAASEPDLRETLQRVEIRSITYLSGGLRVKGYLLAPKDGDALPAVIFNRGGNREFGAWTDERVARVLAPIASWGYVVVASQYRGNGGGEGREEFGGLDVDDVLNLIPLLGSLPRVDEARLGMVGWSRGGMMTYLALARTDRIAAAAIGAGVADAFAAVAERPELEQLVFSELVPGWEEEREAALEARSAIRWPERLHGQTPILLLHGTADWRVSPLQALRMATALYEVKHPFRLVVLEGGDHGLTEHSEEVDRVLRDWLDRYVRDREPWPSLEPHGR